MSSVSNVPKILFSYDDSWGEGIIICPFCKKERSSQEDLQIQDYVDIPMLWCGECGARAFLEAELEEDFNETLEKVGVAKKVFKNTKILTEKELLDGPVFQVNACYIKEVLGRNMLCLYSERKLSLEEMENIASRKISFEYYGKIKEENLFTSDVEGIISDLFREWKEEKEKVELRRRLAFHIQTMKAFDILCKCDDEKDVERAKELGVPYKYIPWSVDNDGIENMNLAVPCNSYNVEEPEDEYGKKGKIPDFVDTSHDGCEIFCTIIFKGKERLITYWGD